MSEEQEKPAGEAPEEESRKPRAGERLAMARREQQISVHEVAKELHLDEHKVRALENNDFELLGAPVFAKGHLKKYAQLVGVESDELLADYYKLTRQDAPPPIVIGRRRVRQELSPGPWIAVIIVILVAAASYWWFAVYSSQATEALPQQESPAEEATEDAVEPASSRVETQEPVLAPEQDAAIPADVVEDGLDTEPQPLAAALDDGEARLVLEFSGDCWTEISDATGRQLFFDMGRSGLSVELSGTPPFAVLFGNVDNVNVNVNGSEYPVSSNNPGSRTARLTIASR